MSPRTSIYVLRGVVVEHAPEQLDRLAASGRVDLLGDRERDRAVLLAPRFLGGLARELDAEPGDVDPVARVALRQPRALLGLGRREDRPGRGREHVAARGEMPAVHVEHGLGRLVERTGTPQLLVGAAAGEPLDLSLDAAVEDHAAVCAEQRLDVPVTRRPRFGALAGYQRVPCLEGRL